MSYFAHRVITNTRVQTSAAVYCYLDGKKVSQFDLSGDTVPNLRTLISYENEHHEEFSANDLHVTKHVSEH